MKRLITLATLLISFNLQAKELDLGSKIPLEDIKMLDISGKKISLDDVKGENGLLVIFSCNTCPWVIKWEDRYVELAEKYKPKGIGVIAINSNETTFKSSDRFPNSKISPLIFITFKKPFSIFFSALNTIVSETL